MSDIKTRSLLGAAVLLCPFAAFAQVGSLSTALDGGMAKGDRAVKLSFRSFNENEASVYGNLALAYGFSDDVQFVLRASAAERTDVGATRSGGSDVEFQAVWRKRNIYLAVGVAQPSTPAQDKAAFTYTVGVNGQDGTNSVFFGVSSVTSKDVTLLAAAFAYRMGFAEGWSFDSSAMFMIRGDNTANVSGVLESEPVFNFGLRYRFDSRQSFFLSAGNSLGDTTGFSLSHRIQKGFGVGAGLEVKF